MSTSVNNSIPPSKEFKEICSRIDGYLTSLTASEEFVDFSSDNEELLELAFVARGVFRELVVPSEELTEAIVNAEDDLKNLAEEFGSTDSGEDSEDNSDDEFDEQDDEE